MSKIRVSPAYNKVFTVYKTILLQFLSSGKTFSKAQTRTLGNISGIHFAN